MIGVGTIGLLGNPGPSQGVGVPYDPAAISYFGAFSTPPSVQRKNAINAFVLTGKASGWWQLADAILVWERMQDQQSGLLNLRQRLYDATAVGSPVFSADGGFTTIGSGDYLNTNFDPTAAIAPNYARDSASFILECLASGQMATSPAGWRQGDGSGLTINPRSTSDLMTFRVNQATTASSFANTSAFGQFAVNRSGASATQAYIDGVAKTVATNANAASVALQSAAFNIGRVDVVPDYQAGTWGGYFIGGSLTAGQFANFKVARAALLAALAPSP